MEARRRVLRAGEELLSMATSAVDFQASSPESLSSTFVNAALNPSNFFARSSMEVVISASNFDGFRDGARVRSSRFGEKIWGRRF